MGIDAEDCGADGVVERLRTGGHRALVLSCPAGPADAGLTLVDELRACDEPALRDVGVIAVLADERARIAAWEHRVDGVLVVPTPVEQLISEVAAVLDRPADRRDQHRTDQLAAARRGEAAE